MVARVFGVYEWLPLPDNHPQKGEIPASSLTRGGGLKRFCSELISSLRKTATSELASPGLRAPPTRCIRIHLVAGWRLSIDSLLGALPGALPGRARGENDAVFAADWPVGALACLPYIARY
ncbi:hypothetical protein NLML1_0383 [Candidatus Nanosynbacter lyticus]|nr:hypothetical protein NLML1_0383 [Candidatus Nanosynbacter lyticus]